MTTALRHPLGGRLAYLVWATGVLAYLVAVFHRSSLGVAALEAGARWGVGASVLALLSVLHLFVYAAMQVPVGVLLDRFGSRRLLLAGAVLMTCGQALFALATDIRMALAARVLLGLGDAMTFVSVLRLVAAWFPARRNPVLVQLTGAIGQLGAIVSAVPLVHLLRAGGWTSAFLVAALAGAIAALLALVVLRDSPYAPRERPEPVALVDVRQDLGSAWVEPGTRLGLWVHFVAQFSGMVFLLLWGYPFLVSGQGLAPSTAGALLTVLTLASICCGPLLGHVVGRHPFHRSSLVLGIVAVTVTAWTAVLLWPGPAPLWLLVVLVLAMAVGGPASMIGFDLARTFNPAGRLGSATGIVNVGGFFASLVTIALIGVALDVLTPGSSGDYTPQAYRWAFAVQYLLWGLGVVQVLRYRRVVRRTLAAQDPEAYAALRRGVAHAT